MKIQVTYDRPPIPIRDIDYSAIDADTYGGEPSDPIGRGATEEKAIEELAAAQYDTYDDKEAELEREHAAASLRGDQHTMSYIGYLRRTPEEWRRS